MTQIPELTDFEHECLNALVRAYGADHIAELARCMAADIAEDDEEAEG